MIKRLFEKLKALRLYFVRRSVWYEDVTYHTGYYRFSEYFDGNNPVFKVHGIPCLQQRGIKEFIFFTETDMVGQTGVVAVKIHYA